MGQMHKFVCQECGFAAKVVNEGRDWGFAGVVVTGIK